MLVAPYSHSSTEILLVLLCQLVYRFGHSPLSYCTSGLFWTNIGPYSHSSSEILLIIVSTGPAQQDFEWGGSSVSQIFFGGGGDKGLSYSQISEGGFKMNKLS